MNRQLALLALAGAAAFAAVSGCGRQEPPAAPATPDTPAVTNSAGTGTSAVPRIVATAEGQTRVVRDPAEAGAGVKATQGVGRLLDEVVPAKPGSEAGRPTDEPAKAGPN